MRARTWEAKGMGSLSGVAGEERVIVRRDAILKTSAFNAECGNAYGANTTGGTFVAKLPKVAPDGGRITFFGNWGQLAANPLTVDAQINNIVHGELAPSQTLDFDEDYVGLTFVWSAADKQWRTFYA